VSAVFVFFAAALAAVELLLPMMAALNKNFTRMRGKRDASQGQTARKKMTAVEWDK
jgi:hypothetical protein